jgi:hypothetical protein
VDFWGAILIFFDHQFFPLAAGIEEFEDVAKILVRANL